MTDQKRLFAIYLLYLIFALLMHSLLITIKQSIYLYAIDTGKAFVLMVMNYIGVLAAPVFFTSVLSKIKYKHLGIALLVVLGICCAFMPFAKELDFPKFLAMLIGFGYSCVRISSYAVLKNIAKEEDLYVSLLNKLDAMFALGFVVTWLVLGATMFLGISWLVFYWLTGGLILISIIVFVFTSFEDSKQPKTMQVATYRLADSLAVLKDPKALLDRTLGFFKDVLESASLLPKLFYYSMMVMFSLCVALISVVQMHFIKYVPSLSLLFNNLPNVDAYLLIFTFFAMFLGRIFASFVIPIFSAVPVLMGSLLALIGVLLTLSFQTDAFTEANSTRITQLNDVPSIFWLVPMIGFTWAPVMPTLCGIVFHHVGKRIYHVAGLVILIIFGIEAIWDGMSSSIFEQFNLNIALILGVIPIILLMIISTLFLNDLKNKEQSSTAEAAQMKNEELTITIK